MPWVESVSPSFRARHESDESDGVARLLESMERTRDRLAALFPRTVADLTVVFHRSGARLDAARPQLALARRVAAPALRRYLVGWADRDEIHVLGPRALDARASGVAGSLETLRLAPAALYARVVVLANNRTLTRGSPRRRVALAREWTWLVEGAASWLAGQTAHARPAIASRLHEGQAPAFPPAPRDAALLAGTVMELLAERRGEDAVVGLAVRTHPEGPRAALAGAFGGPSLAAVEREWRARLAALPAGGAQRSDETR